MTGSYYDKYKKIQRSDVFKAIYAMPKPAVHHVHYTALAPVDLLIKLTYKNHVYLNERAGQFRVNKVEMKHDGF